MPQRNKKSRITPAVGCGIAFLLIVGMFGFLYWLILKQQSQAPSSADQGGVPAGAHTACRRSVSRLLVAPATAKWGPIDEETVEEVASHKRWKMLGTVDSQNGFGALIRSSWVCVVYIDSNGDARVSAQLLP